MKLCSLPSAYLHVILLLSLTIPCLQPITTATAAPTNESDRLALVKLKELINSDPLNILSSWSESLHFCNWYGVSCGHKHPRVTALLLQGRALSGSISPYIGNLSFLRRIDFQDNFLQGEIPKEVTLLSRLQYLYLRNNSFTGEIPRNLTNCPELRVMDLEENKLTGSIPVELASLRRLETLIIRLNQLTGGIPRSLGNISSLQQLSIADNNFWGNIPDEIGRLPRLSLFIVAANNLTGTIPYSLYNRSTLSNIQTARNRLTGTLPANIGLTLPNLQILSFSTNNFSGPIPVSLSNASRLEVLILSRNNFVGQVPAQFGNLLHLQDLRVSGNNLGSNSAMDLDFITSLGNCTKLQFLYFGDNIFGGSLANSIRNFSMQLMELYMAGNQISGIIPAALDNLINLYILDMSQNLFEGTIPTFFGKFQKLQGLHLDGNRLSGQIPSSIGYLTGLVQLNLSRNKLEGSIPSSLADCKSLEELDIAENNLSGAIPKDIMSSQLLVLNLSQNSLSGILPVEISNSKNIYGLDVSKNKLSADIPNTLGDCLSLEYLYLQGQIPKDLQKLPVLVHLNLSFNNLEGEVPTEGIFHSATAISLTGNQKLCGGIPELHLQACGIKTKKQGKSHVFKLTLKIVTGSLCFLLFSSLLYYLYRRRKLEKKSSSVPSKTDLLSNVSYMELYQLTGGFSPSNLIGSGSFGSVYKGVLHHEGTMVAVKVLNLHQKGASESFLSECNVLRNIRHRNLVKVLTCCSSVDHKGDEFKALVFKFMSNGSLEKWLHPDTVSENQSRNLSFLQRLDIAIDVAFALHYLHDHCETPIIHCDLKPSNVLLDNDMVAYISDFGSARLLSPKNDLSQYQTGTIGIKGSIGYAAPEYGMGGEASTQGDVYSYGIFLLEMFTEKKPTHKMFSDSFNLHNFVKMALPERLVNVVDRKLLPREGNEIAVATKDDYNSDDQDDIDVEAKGERCYIGNLSQMNDNVHKCLLSVLEIGLSCSLESPKERTSMGHVTNELHRTKNAFLGIEIDGRGTR
ncbi:probable LRR receptor-like serine/threonine-protein kinase At3g47570 isoform X2 [Carya illinoinensis]|uniref:probable LRR receptor-like serine/threonine-protein kinase At3g47570 isoform X2 n=1 Tax=Carya illinoinensis TaxID=32201 RepID=UPI001C721D99|nr:probable LRR receptor-like serine/threonine-protein kinase At3g47570 isoform X2 [Carya illinoinensis]